MKEICDNHCETCPMHGQMYCAVMFARSIHQTLPVLSERLEQVEMELRDMRREPEQAPVINPLKYDVPSPVLSEED